MIERALNQQLVLGEPFAQEVARRGPERHLLRAVYG